MERNVFTKKEVGDFFNKNYVMLYFHLIKGKHTPFSKKSKISGYPTHIYYNKDGKEFKRTCGGMGTEKFIDYGKKMLDYKGKDKKKSVKAVKMMSF